MCVVGGRSGDRVGREKRPKGKQKTERGAHAKQQVAAGEQLGEGEMNARSASCDGLCTFATDAACQLDVLRHDGDALGVDGAQVGVFEQADEVGLGCLLEGRGQRSLGSEGRS